MNVFDFVIVQVFLILAFYFISVVDFFSFSEIEPGNHNFLTQTSNLCIFIVDLAGPCSLLYETQPFFIIMRIFIDKNRYLPDCTDDFLLIELYH